MRVTYPIIKHKLISIKNIFKDNWDQFYYKFKSKIRDIIPITIDKTLKCNTKDAGFRAFYCDKCGFEKIVCFTCKSRFCNCCGKVATDNWIANALPKFINVKYRHITFTLPEEFRNIAMVNRKMFFNMMFKAAANAILEWAKSRNFIPGIIAVIHSFGKELNFNPHIHILCTCGGLVLPKELWNNEYFFPIENVIKPKWKYSIIKFLRTQFKNGKLDLPPEYQHLDSYSKFNTFLSSVYDKKWYVNIKLKLVNAEEAISYIGRYVKRPVIAESRIKYYDGEKIKFIYEDKETKQINDVWMSVDKFIGSLIRHIPDKHFRQIRYYGIYANSIRKKSKEIINKFFQKDMSIKTLKAFSWVERIYYQTGQNPIKCPKCKCYLTLSHINFGPKYANTS